MVNVNVDVFFIPFVIGIRDKDSSVVTGSGYETCFPRQKRLSRFERSTFWERSTESWKGTQATFQVLYNYLFRRVLSNSSYPLFSRSYLYLLDSQVQRTTGVPWEYDMF